MVLVLTVYFIPCYTQSEKIDPEILDMIATGNRRSLNIMVSFDEKVDFELLKTTFLHQQVPVNQRPKMVIEALKSVAEKAQGPLLEACVNKYNRQISKLIPFWIVNKVFIECQPSIVYNLASLPGVNFISIEKGIMRLEEPTYVGTGEHERSPGLAEPGLYAINAHKMWELGYSGRGRLVYNYDTGVWPDHPAFNERFIGKRFPMSQSWIGYSSAVPTGEINSHGTHVLGTMTGLVEETNDTLGVAVKAYWIANDLVGTSVSSLPPLEAMIQAFEWALNPDNDINTSYDVPDVINNSWRWYDAPDQLHCGQGMVVDLMNAIEAAGIANVFAGGNFGPDNTTISSPQRINTSKVNTFSVGSVNANLNYPYPISDFSSRGPSQCEGSENDKIHPQVVAPGEMVRSAWGTNGYNTISGTSMACPHVSGAVLLLKEAFPFLSGDQLLWALFRTAVDFGESGEDNTFGNGLIDVFAAYEYLADVWQPADPFHPEWDLSVDLISGVEEGGVLCNNIIYPEIHYSNKGSSVIDSIQIKYWFSGIRDTFELMVTNELLPSEKTSIHLGELFLDESAQYELNVLAQIPGIETEYDLYNNRLKASIRKFNVIDIPFIENFEDSSFYNVWWLENPDRSVTWEIVSLTGHENNQMAGSMQFFNYSPRDKQIDKMVLFNVHLPETEETMLSFDIAYAPFLKNVSENRDTLRVKVYIHCDPSTSKVIYEKAGDSLITHNVISLNFHPQNPAQWRHETLSLQEFKGNDISVVFESVNLKWNNLYIDNITLDTFPMLSSGKIPDSPQDNHLVSIYPNPAYDVVRLFINASFKAVGTIRLLNTFGELIDERDVDFEEPVFWDVSRLPGGYYIFQISDNKYFKYSKGFVK